MSRPHRRGTGAPVAPIVAILLAFAVLVGVAVVAVVMARSPDTSSGSTAGTADVATPPLQPAAVDVPAIGARSSLIPLGRDAAGGWAIPPIDAPGQASWYSDGVAPGQSGSAVVLGHVNGCTALAPGSNPPRCADGARTGGVFERLAQIRTGDTATITGVDGRTVTFVATRDAEVVAKDRFPTDQVLAASPLRELRLISCGGDYDPAAHRYTDNVIVTMVAG